MQNEEFLAEFGARIKQLRTLKGWTQKELARRSGYNSGSSNSTINKIESGKLDLSISRLMDFSRIFGVSAAYLLGEGSGEEEAKSLAQQNAMNIMEKRLSEQEKDDLMRGLEFYFTQRFEAENA